jgi:2EXR family
MVAPRRTKKLVYMTPNPNTPIAPTFTRVSIDPNAFPQFNGLPVEVRDIIWGLATEGAEPQVIRVITHAVQNIWCADEDRIIITSTTPCPVPLLINRESRNVAIKHYQPLFPAIPVYMDPKKDTVFFKDPEALKLYFDTCMEVDLRNPFATDPQMHFLEMGLRRLAIAGYVNQLTILQPRPQEVVLMRDLLKRMAYLDSLALQFQGDQDLGHTLSSSAIHAILQKLFVRELEEEWESMRGSKEGLPTVRVFAQAVMEDIAKGAQVPMS